MSWLCKKCGHNRSFHAYEWNRFRGVWDTHCRSTDWGRTGTDRCRCGEFTDTEEGGAQP